MNIAKSIMILCLLFFLSSCARVDTNIVKYKNFNPTYLWMHEPSIGKPVKADIEQTMTVQYLAAVFDGFISNDNYEIKTAHDTPLFPKIISPEDEYIIWGNLPNGDLIIRNKSFARAVMYDKQLSNLELALIARKNGEVYGYAPFSNEAIAVEKLDHIIKLEPQKVSIQGDMRQELVYQGKTKDAIKIKYLEYAVDMAKPASAQDLTYNLTESNTIEFKGMLMNIIEATEDDILFVVTRYMTNQH